MLSCPRCAQPLHRKFVKDLIGEDEENTYECGQCGCEIIFNEPTYCYQTVELFTPAEVLPLFIERR